MTILRASFCVLLALCAGPAAAQMGGHGGGHGSGHDAGAEGRFGAHHGADGTGHDEVLMPGLLGEDASAEESAELQALFRAFPLINRETERLENGIRTYTWSADEDIAAIIISHVAGMMARVDDGRDPKVFVQSPTLDIVFEKNSAITTTLEVTDQGIWVVQTSEDPEVVAALQTHADEVTDMVNRGMQSVHERMMSAR